MKKVWLKIAPFMEDLLGIQPPRVLVECWQLPSVQGFLDSTQHERHHTISAKQRTMMNNVTMTFKAGQLGFQRFLGSLDFKSWINQTLDSHREHKYQPQRPSAVLQHWSALMSGARRKRPSKKKHCHGVQGKLQLDSWKSSPAWLTCNEYSCTCWSAFKCFQGWFSANMDGRRKTIFLNILYHLSNNFKSTQWCSCCWLRFYQYLPVMISCPYIKPLLVREWHFRNLRKLRLPVLQS